MKHALRPVLILTFLLMSFGRVAPGAGTQPPGQLLDSLDHYLLHNKFDTALIAGTQLINMPVAENDEEAQKILIAALNKTAAAYYQFCDYRRSYELLIKALDLCEKWEYDEYLPRILVDISNIYYRFGQVDMSRQYDIRALEACRDSVLMVGILNNLGDSANTPDSVLFYLSRALDISDRHGQVFRGAILSNLALYYQKQGLFDEAVEYFRMALLDAYHHEDAEREAENLYLQARLFQECGQIDSAFHYIARSNTLAEQNNLLRIQVDNYLAMSEIEEHKGRRAQAFEYFKIYARLRDSTLNNETFGNINQLQRLYEVSKTNQQIEQLTVDRLLKQRTITYQMLVMGVLVLACVIFFFQKRNLNRAYKALMKKNLRLFEIQEKGAGKFSKEYQKNLDGETQQKLMDQIMAVMEDTPTVCDTEFSLDKLAQLVHSNHAYVSQVINTLSGMNFRSFLIGYRIREAQQLFSEPDSAKYTIEAVAGMVGFKSRTAFREAFKEITGVTPVFYIRSLRRERD